MGEVKQVDEKALEQFFPEVFKDKDYKRWLQVAYSRIEPIRESNERLPFNISEITFAFHQYPNGEVSKKFAVGCIGNTYDAECRSLFEELLKKKCKEGERWLKKQDLNKAIGVGIGYESGRNFVIWKFYVMYPDGVMKAINCENGKIIEEKVYKHSPSGEYAVASGKHERYQFNLEAEDKEAFKAIKLLRKYGHINREMEKLCERMILTGFALDTISVSPTRGIAIYFE